jgi:hypothetical protein
MEIPLAAILKRESSDDNVETIDLRELVKTTHFQDK